MLVFVAYAGGKEVIYTDKKLVYYPKNISALAVQNLERAEVSRVSQHSQGAKQCEVGISN
jgi:hypothetical protein